MTARPTPSELILRAARRFKQLGYLENGVPAGWNGPHHDPQTPLRNSAHWVVILLRAAELSEDPWFAEAARTLTEVILSDDSFAAGRVPVAREKASKDTVNGVIGVAWIVEGLVEAGNRLSWREPLDAAVKLCEYFPFDTGLGAWGVREHDGALRGIDSTLNHQIWYAMARAMCVPHAPHLADELRQFFGTLDRHCRLNGEQMVSHMLSFPLTTKLGLISRAESMVRLIDPWIGNSLLRKAPVYKRLHALAKYHGDKETGYIIFTLHGLARIKAMGWDLGRVEAVSRKAFARSVQPDFMAALKQNAWSYGYNPPGFEVMEVFRQFGDDGALERAAVAEHYRIQLDMTYGSDGAFTGIADPETAEARLYPLALLSNEDLSEFERIVADGGILR